MSRKNKKGEKVKWKFFWKNVGGFGMLLRVASGVALIAAAAGLSGEDDPKAQMLSVMGGVFIIEGLLRWCSLRALFKRPTRKAFLRHYPEVKEA